MYCYIGTNSRFSVFYALVHGSIDSSVHIMYCYIGTNSQFNAIMNWHIGTSRQLSAFMYWYIGTSRQRSRLCTGILVLVDSAVHYVLAYWYK